MMVLSVPCYPPLAKSDMNSLPDLSLTLPLCAMQRRNFFFPLAFYSGPKDLCAFVGPPLRRLLDLSVPAPLGECKRHPSTPILRGHRDRALARSSGPRVLPFSCRPSVDNHRFSRPPMPGFLVTWTCNYFSLFFPSCRGERPQGSLCRPNLVVKPTPGPPHISVPGPLQMEFASSGARAPPIPVIEPLH